MQLVDNISLKIIQNNNQQDPISEIIIAGQSTGKKIKARLLEQALEWQDGYLLFTTEDVLFEEALTITLFDKQFNQIDQICIGAIYSTDFLTDLTIESNDQVSFSFLGKWRLTILPTFKFRVPRFSIDELARQHHFKQRIVLNKRQ